MSKPKATPGIERRERDGRTVYRAVVYDKRTRRKITKTFGTITAAKQWRTDAQAALRAGTMTADRGPTLTDAVELWLDGIRAGRIPNRSGDPYKPRAVRAYDESLRRYALPVLGSYRLREIRPQDVQAFIDALVRDERAPTTIQSALTPLCALYRRAAARGDVPSNPTLRLEKPAVRSRLRIVQSPVDVAARLAALDAADRPLWATAFYAGLRRGEMIGLRWEDVDLAKGEIHVRRGWDAVEGEIAPKSRQGRRDVPIPAVLRDYLLEHRMNSTGDGRVFASNRQVRTQAERAGKRWTDQGHERLTLHDARHTYASLMIAANVNAKALSTYMGHASIGITFDLYGHLMPGSQAEAAGLLNAYLARALGGSTSPITSPDPVGSAA